MHYKLLMEVDLPLIKSVVCVGYEPLQVFKYVNMFLLILLIIHKLHNKVYFINKQDV